MPVMFLYPSAKGGVTTLRGSSDHLLWPVGSVGGCTAGLGVAVPIKRDPKWDQGDLDSNPASATGVQTDDRWTLSLF